MTVKNIIDEDFVNYKYPCMTIEFPTCTMKCGDSCQNKELNAEPDIYVNTEALISRYVSNDISKAICCMGMEPFDSFSDLLFLILATREGGCDDDIVIYTGYEKNECVEHIRMLSIFKNIVVKFGRYIPGDDPHYDEVLGVNLASDNQYAERIS